MAQRGEERCQGHSQSQHQPPAPPAQTPTPQTKAKGTWGDMAGHEEGAS